MLIVRFGQPFRAFALFSHDANRRTNSLLAKYRFLVLWIRGFIWSGGWPFLSS